MPLLFEMRRMAAALGRIASVASGQSIALAPSMSSDKALSLAALYLNLGKLDEAKEHAELASRVVGAHVRRMSGRDNIHVWMGECHVHAGIDPENIRLQRSLHPEAEFLVHPECGCSTSVIEAISAGDVDPENMQVLSTEGMIRRPAESSAMEFIVATEVGILHRLRRENPTKRFHAANERASCAYMKVTTLPKVRTALLNLEHRITVEPEVAAKARRAIERMIAIGGKGGASGKGGPSTVGGSVGAAEWRAALPLVRIGGVRPALDASAWTAGAVAALVCWTALGGPALAWAMTGDRGEPPEHSDRLRCHARIRRASNDRRQCSIGHRRTRARRLDDGARGQDGLAATAVEWRAFAQAGDGTPDPYCKPAFLNGHRQRESAAEQQQHAPGQFAGAFPVHQKHALFDVHRDHEQCHCRCDGDAGVIDAGHPA